MSEYNNEHLMHSDTWWMRALDGELTADEAERWAEHRACCATCRRDWDAIKQMDRWLLVAPEVPELPATFTAQTVQRIEQRLRWQRWLSALAATLIVGLVAWLVFGYVGLAVGSLQPLVSAILIGWQPLLGSMLRTLVGLLWAWKNLLPLVAGGIACSMLLLMPNGMLATAALLWLTRQRFRMISA